MRSNSVATLLVIVIMAGMVVVVSAQVFLRYVMNLSLDWAEEISTAFVRVVDFPCHSTRH